MAFSDKDLRSHLRNIGLTGDSTTSNYSKLDEQGIRDPKTGEGKPPHMQDLKEKNEVIFTLAHVDGTLRWEK